MSQKIVFTGGGTAGHVTPNIALIEALREEGWQIHYIGSKTGVEKDMMTQMSVSYDGIRCGKLRRYFSWKNLVDPLNVLLGILEAYRLLRQFKPTIVFSKGGFVALPVVIAAKLLRIPIIAHESDMSPGLANRLSFPFVDKICVTFAPAKDHFKQKEKVVVTGTPIRKALLQGDKAKGLAECGFQADKPCLLVVGGSQGANAINQCVRQALTALGKYQVIHLCGRGKVDAGLINRAGYCQFEYADSNLADLFAASDLVISRAGANALYELLVLEKPHVLIPLSRQASRGDQLQNARYFKDQHISEVLFEEDLTPESLVNRVTLVEKKQDEIMKNIRAQKLDSATGRIIEMIRAYS